MKTNDIIYDFILPKNIILFAVRIIQSIKVNTTKSLKKFFWKNAKRTFKNKDSKDT